MKAFHTIAIAICDNDFENTFRPLLETIMRVIRFNDYSLSREVVKRLILEGIEFHYLAFQCDGDTRRREGAAGIAERVRNKILFDEEAEEHIHSGHSDGYGSWALAVACGMIWSY